jgi:hypothetical protein
MQFTGERFIPTEQGRIRLEHYHRYAAVLNAIKGKTVLDLPAVRAMARFFWPIWLILLLVLTFQSIPFYMHHQLMKDQI